MTIQSSDFLRSSEHCLSLDEEVGYRNAVSRAYYAMFHRAGEALENIPSAEHNHHANLINYMQGRLGLPQENISAARLKLLAYDLRQMRQARNEADYRLTESKVNADVAKESLLTAQHFFNRIS
ncbi:HEPN domain-containing protein [Escherichia coli]|uniref:HEPN domain-containing protein n=1 Tax=Escherichia coli TaxID=562 RepID=UPI0039C924AC